MPRPGERAPENHPWHARNHKRSAAEKARMKIAKLSYPTAPPGRNADTLHGQSASHRRAPAWTCPNCGETDCGGECGGGDF